MTIDIALFTGNTTFRESIILTLRQLEGFNIVPVAEIPHELTNHAVKKCQLILLDLCYDHQSCLNFVKESLRIKPELKILLISRDPETLYHQKLIQAGASGIIPYNAGKKTYKQRIMEQFS